MTRALECEPAGRMKEKEVELPEEISPEWVSREHSRLMEDSKGAVLKLDCHRLHKLDALSLAWLAHLQETLEKSGGRLVLAKLSPELKKDLAKVTLPEPEVPENKEPPGFAAGLGEAAIKLGSEVRDTLVLFSESVYWSTAAVFKPKTLLRADAINQMVRLGSTALPIVLLLSTLIGFTLALQSGIQLQKFGATVFLASGMGISMVTEIGPVMTAVILAGRSGSSITAEIATMVVQEEVGALPSMAINPIHFLVLP